MRKSLCRSRVHCVYLGESFQTHIYLQNVASIEPRTSPVKFTRSSGAAAQRKAPQAGLRALRGAGRRCGPRGPLADKYAFTDFGLNLS